MKINFWKSAFALLVSIVAIASCSETAPVPPPEPQFPTNQINKTVAAGESVNININPNMAWEVSLSGNGVGNEFWIDDDGLKSSKISGKEGGAVVITVQFASDEKFDVNRVCEVKLTMNGQSKVIAVLTLPSIGRTFELYTKAATETGFAEQFGDSKITETSLATFAGDVTYTVPVRVVTNYNWTLSAPEWLAAVTADAERKTVVSGEAGATEFILQAKLSKDVMTGAEAMVKFIDSSNTEASFDLKVTLPSFQDRVETTLNTTFIFNAAGSVQNLNGSFIENSVANFELLSTDAAAVRVVEWNETGKYYATSFADWATVTKTKYTDYSENDVLAKFSVEIAAAENTTYSERFADVFVIPASKASVPFDDWFDPNTGNLKEEYSKYILGRISQIGKEKDYVALSENPEEVYLTDFVKYTEPQWWSEQLGTTNVFELVYKDKFSDAVLMFAKPFASYKIFDYDFVEVPEAEYDAFWLSFLPFEQNMKGRVAMDASKFTKENVEVPESFVVFYDQDGRVLGGILCRYTSKGSSVDQTSNLKLEYGDAEFARLSQEDQMYMYLNGNFNVTEIYKVVTKDRMLNFNCTLEFSGCMMIDPATMQEIKTSPITMDPSLPSLYLYFNGMTSKTEVVFLFQNDDKVNLAALYVVYDPSIKVESPFKFVYPDLINGKASIESYSGDISELGLGGMGLTQDKVFLLKYTDPSVASVATVTVPSAPFTDSAWNSVDPNTGAPLANYWLTHEMDITKTKMTVYMAEAGKVDCFVFYSGGLPSSVLVCTLEIAQ